MPLRIQLKRTKGWRMPPGTVKVDRTTKWGNPFKIGETHALKITPRDAAEAVAWFQKFLEKRRSQWFDFSVREIIELRGKDLACWCRLCERHADGKALGEPCPDCAPCHADPLGAAANRPLSLVSDNYGDG